MLFRASSRLCISTWVRGAPAVPQLQEHDAPLLVHRLGDWLPSLNLLGLVDSGDAGVPEARAGRVCCLLTLHYKHLTHQYPLYTHISTPYRHSYQHPLRCLLGMHCWGGLASRARSCRCEGGQQHLRWQHKSPGHLPPWYCQCVSHLDSMNMALLPLPRVQPCLPQLQRDITTVTATVGPTLPS